MSKRTQDYRKIYKQYFGTVPKDTDGRSYDIHHIDGNHNNNSSDNLIAIPIKEHYDKHYAAKDWKACVMIGLRMRLPVEEISMLNSLAAKKRVEEGTHPSQLEFVCPHCNVTGKGAANAKRWHFDNCKKRK